MKAGQSVVSASLEDYLEAIHHIAVSNGAARAKDIAMALNVKNASVTQALRSLAEKNLVNYAPYEVITLTPQGQSIADDVIQRHEVLEQFLSQVLGFPADEADENACIMEHSINRPILDRLAQFMEYFQTCPLGDIHWDQDQGYFCGGQNGHQKDNCGRDVCGDQNIQISPDLDFSNEDSQK
ncbi:MAG: metal-dependent transcriptional regulator [bacterium]|nr:metal-dependent transcriptional regulator [bacterium]